MPKHVKHIEWQDMDKKKFYFFGPTLFLGIRALLYPANLIKIRLQVQRKTTLYNGSLDAFTKVIRTEGVRGLYKGYLVSCAGLFAGQCYITTYELVRSKTAQYNYTIRGFLAGGCASIVGQTITVPVDIISQKLMIQGQGDRKVKLKGARILIRETFHQHGPGGFYKGYFASLMTYAPSSAIWWASYGFYTGVIGNLSADGTHRLLVLGSSGVLAGVTAATLTNPLDVIRTRLQVFGGTSMLVTFRSLLHEEGVAAVVKGLSARIISMAPSSLIMVVGYETIKKLSLREELTCQREEEGYFEACM
ncbi:predicted protein [Nematostella vectensis]|uniref:Solute carrier family 25 member 44 n=1 Tax=Nematostella vectensis TaxID=45351 RepID=A7S1Q1_NEMVE|nr:solute carrier family 25 member 44 [Nematostella vectensis]EDO42357.1 predicted protein [Nematostella vectensis]|eukprot:XP_001634420.1 predicted protein [Nematostella vectensis]